VQDATPLVDEMDDLHRRLSSDQLALFRLIAEVDRAASWRDAGARDMAAWLAMRYGISEWKARRWIAAAHALEGLPSMCDALASGRLGVDKVVELARFASFETEDGLIAWASRVSVGAVRRRADLEVGGPIDDVRDADRQRFLTWWYSDDRTRLGLEGELPAAEGTVVARALERLAERIPVMPGEEDPVFASARRADALVALCSAKIAEDKDADRATVVVHVRVGTGPGSQAADIEGGPVIHPETVRRLLCEARSQTLLEDGSARPLAVGRMTREPSAWMLRQLRYRDVGCTFPGCGSQRFTKAHHVTWWRHGGTTDLDNLVLVCSFHHKLVHEHCWRVELGEDGVARWFRPDGSRFCPGPSPTLATESEREQAGPAPP
jgi:hypothetical protein